ncbi:2Fe-2S iron-sulfur cluster-binding protein [Paenibacillus caui]|uniref:2Fe-2S iron-sulfur cluster-binding protein n=1 Tax=Paenibacillus caui TaxID=2873927 RepID=UPI001CA9DEF8|nr:2Fe-2S iron-sulfur cluster-binding protein [Paenibacillus caui]
MENQIRFEPSGKTVKVHVGTTVLAAARKSRIHIPSRCGGNAGCLMCKVKTDPEHAAALSSLTPAEERKLGPLARQGVRLACQAKILGNAVVQLPEDPLKAAVRKQLQAQAEDDALW